MFPARKKICYTVDIKYLLLEMTCTNALSFSTAYRITRLFDNIPDVVRRRMKYETSEERGENRVSIRRTNEAFRAFVKYLDTSRANITGKLYSCDDCEVPFSPQDCEELGIDAESAIGMKRLKAIVIDGTAAGILTKLPEYDRHTDIVSAAKGGLSAVYLLQETKHKNTISKFLNIWRAQLRSWKPVLKTNTRDVTNGTGQDPEYLMFWIRNPSELTIPGIQSCKTISEHEF